MQSVKNLSAQNIKAEKALRAALKELRAIPDHIEAAVVETGQFHIDSAPARQAVADAIQSAEEAHSSMCAGHQWLNEKAEELGIPNPGLETKDGSR